LLKPLEIVLVEDEGHDGSYEICKRLSEEMSSIVHLHSDVRQGKGGAIKVGTENAKGDIVLTTDVDVPTTTIGMNRLVNLLDTADISTILRIREFPLVRRVASFGYGALTLAFFGVNLDFQSGTMSFKRDVGLDLLKDQRVKGFAWSTEFLIRALKRNHKVCEINEYYSYNENSTVDVRKVWFQMFKDLIDIWRYTK